MQKSARLLRSLFLLRLGLGIFLLMWSVDKLVAPETSLTALANFSTLTLNTSVIMMLGACELVLSIFIILGFYKTLTYGMGLAIHTVSTVAHYRQLLSPFGDNHLFIATIPVFFAFLALFLLRDFDTLWTLGKKKSLFAQ